MTTYARKINNVAVDVITTDPTTCFHPDIASQFITVPDGTQNGATWTSNKWTNPAPVQAVAEVAIPPKVGPIEFKLLFSVQERLAIKASQDPAVQDFFEIANDPRLPYVDLALKSTKDALQYLASKSLIASDRVAEILSGQAR